MLATGGSAIKAVSLLKERGGHRHSVRLHHRGPRGGGLPFGQGTRRETLRRGFGSRT
jgi:hypothetical protein